MNTLTDQLKKSFVKHPWATLAVGFGIGATIGALNLLPAIAVVALKGSRKVIVSTLVSKGANILAGS